MTLDEICGFSLDVWADENPYTLGAAAQLSTDQTAAPAAKRLPDTSLGGVAGTLPVAKVMQSAGGNVLPGDVRDDTVTGAAAGGTLKIEADNPGVRIGGMGIG